MKQKDIFLIVIPTFILTVLWVIFSIYHNLVSSTITSPLSFQILPIAGSFDKKAIENIKKRNDVTPVYTSLQESQTGASPSAEASPTATSEGGLTP